MNTSSKIKKKKMTKKSQFPVTPLTTADDEERTSQGKITSKQKGLKWSKNVPDSKIYEPVKRDDSHMANDETGFLNLGQAEPTHAYDVGGQWKLLYKKPGGDNIDEDDKPKGPGMKSRKKSKSPPPSTKVKKTKTQSPKPPPKLSARRRRFLFPIRR